MAVREVEGKDGRHEGGEGGEGAMDMDTEGRRRHDFPDRKTNLTFSFLHFIVQHDTHMLPLDNIICRIDLFLILSSCQIIAMVHHPLVPPRAS